MTQHLNTRATHLASTFLPSIVARKRVLCHVAEPSSHFRDGLQGLVGLHSHGCRDVAETKFLAIQDSIISLASLSASSGFPTIHNDHSMNPSGSSEFAIRVLARQTSRSECDII
jgi:hypothetical protein